MKKDKRLMPEFDEKLLCKKVRIVFSILDILKSFDYKNSVEILNETKHAIKLIHNKEKIK